MVADGAMGTMLQAADLTLDDFEGLEGCNEILNVTRPDVVRGIHDAYFAVGCDASRPTRSAPTSPTSPSTASPTASASWPRPAPGSPARSPTATSTPDRPRWVIGSVGPGTKLPTLGHAPYATLRDAYQQEVDGLLAGGADAVLVETAQDLLQTKSAIVGARRAMRAAGVRVPLIAQVTVETTGTMLLGSRDRRRADRAGAARHRPDRAQLRDRPGRDERAPALPVPHARIPLSVMPNAGLPELGPDGATYPLTPQRAGRRALSVVRPRVRAAPGRRLLRHHARSTCGRSSRRSARSSRSRAQGPRRGGRVLALPVGAVPAGRRRA